MPRALTIRVFDYLNYRDFLRDAYVELKEKQRGFSYRWFARRCGMSSPNFLKLVIDDRRNLGPESAGRFAQALDLGQQETDFFLELVAFNQATSAHEKNLHYDRIGKYRKHRAVKRLERKAFDYLSHWYYPAIRELVSCDGFVDDPAVIARQLRPQLTEAEARRALNDLVRLGVLRRDESGRLQQGEPLLSTGPEVRSLAVGNFHRQMIQRASDSIETVESAEREISALTVALSKDGFRVFKEKIQKLRAELLELSADESEPTRVVQFNFQAFPLATTEEPKE